MQSAPIGPAPMTRRRPRRGRSRTGGWRAARRQGVRRGPPLGVEAAPARQELHCGVDLVGAANAPCSSPCRGVPGRQGADAHRPAVVAGAWRRHGPADDHVADRPGLPPRGHHRDAADPLVALPAAGAPSLDDGVEVGAADPAEVDLDQDVGRAIGGHVDLDDIDASGAARTAACHPMRAHPVFRTLVSLFSGRGDASATARDRRCDAGARAGHRGCAGERSQDDGRTPDAWRRACLAASAACCPPFVALAGHLPRTTGPVVRRRSGTGPPRSSGVSVEVDRDGLLPWPMRLRFTALDGLSACSRRTSRPPAPRCSTRARACSRAQPGVRHLRRGCSRPRPSRCSTICGTYDYPLSVLRRTPAPRTSPTIASTHLGEGERPALRRRRVQRQGPRRRRTARPPTEPRGPDRSWWLPVLDRARLPSDPAAPARRSDGQRRSASALGPAQTIDDAGHLVEVESPRPVRA